MKRILVPVMTLIILFSCKKDTSSKPIVPVTGGPLNFTGATVNDISKSSLSFYNINFNPVIKLSFSAPVDKSSVATSISLSGGGLIIPGNFSYSNSDSTIILQPSSQLKPLTSYKVTILQSLKSTGRLFFDEKY